MGDDARPAGGDIRPLNVLFVGGYDSSNYAYVELVRGLSARGHRCTVVVQNERDVVNNKMFISAGIPMVALSRFPLSDLDSVDFVVSGPFARLQTKALFQAIYERHKFLISFANLFSSVTMWVAPDLLIASSEAKFEEFARSGLIYNMVAVGNPQYDPLVRAREARPRIELDEIRKVLVVDQGAYPLGDLGKSQLAKTLVSIASNNPQMTFHVKPRYLPNEDGDHLHAMSDHLYTYLEETPENLVLIHESTILEELILDYDAMITLWSTAHLDAAALGLPLLLIGGFDSVDVFDVRKQRVAAAYEHLRETGCLVDWRDLQSGPCPFRHVSETYIREEFHDASAPCAPRIVDLMEKIDAEVLKRGKAFSGNFELPLSDFMRDVGGLETWPVGSGEDRLNRQLFRGMNSVAQGLAFEHRCMGFAFDMSEILEFWKVRVGADASEEDVESLVRQVSDVGMRLKADYFESHPEEVASDPFVQDYYFDWLYETRRFGDLFAYSGRVVVPASLELYRGRAYQKRGRLLRAARHMTESFSISLQEPVRVLKKDKNIRVLLAATDTNLVAHMILFFMHHYRRYEALSVLDVQARPDLDALVYYRMKALVALGLVADAKALHRGYVTAIEDKPPARRGRGLKRMALRVVIGFYRIVLRRYAARLR